MTAHPPRSRNWFGRRDLCGVAHRAWPKAAGFGELVFDGRPGVGIANPWSELNNRNAHLRQVADAVKGHGAHLRRAHEGHLLRHRRAAGMRFRLPARAVARLTGKELRDRLVRGLPAGEDEIA